MKIVKWFDSIEKLNEYNFELYNSVLNFEETVIFILKNQPIILQEYDRLNGSSLSKQKTPIEILVDKETGFHQDEWYGFFDFVKNFIYIPTVLDMLESPSKS